jgi:diketogulonate reductase-like aldo/keto reductase
MNVTVPSQAHQTSLCGNAAQERALAPYALQMTLRCTAVFFPKHYSFSRSHITTLSDNNKRSASAILLWHKHSGAIVIPNTSPLEYLLAYAIVLVVGVLATIGFQKCIGWVRRSAQHA